MKLASQALGLIVLMAVVTGLALLLGAADLGTALGIGQIAFVLGLVYLLVRS